MKDQLIDLLTLEDCDTDGVELLLGGCFELLPDLTHLGHSHEFGSSLFIKPTTIKIVIKSKGLY